MPRTRYKVVHAAPAPPGNQLWSAARLLIEAEADLNHPGTNGETPLMWAARLVYRDDVLAMVKLRRAIVGQFL